MLLVVVAISWKDAITNLSNPKSWKLIRTSQEFLVSLNPVNPSQLHCSAAPRLITTRKGAVFSGHSTGLELNAPCSRGRTGQLTLPPHHPFSSKERPNFRQNGQVGLPFPIQPVILSLSLLPPIILPNFNFLANLFCASSLVSRFRFRHSLLPCIFSLLNLFLSHTLCPFSLSLVIDLPC